MSVVTTDLNNMGSKAYECTKNTLMEMIISPPNVVIIVGLTNHSNLNTWQFITGKLSQVSGMYCI